VYLNYSEMIEAFDGSKHGFRQSAGIFSTVRPRLSPPIGSDGRCSTPHQGLLSRRPSSLSLRLRGYSCLVSWLSPHNTIHSSQLRQGHWGCLFSYFVSERRSAGRLGMLSMLVSLYLSWLGKELIGEYSEGSSTEDVRKYYLRKGRLDELCVSPPVSRPSLYLQSIL
jgi:hypothetical protein